MKTPDHSEVNQVFKNSHHQPLLHLARETMTPILIVEGLSNSILFVLYRIIYRNHHFWRFENFPTLWYEVLHWDWQRNAPFLIVWFIKVWLILCLWLELSCINLILKSKVKFWYEQTLNMAFEQSPVRREEEAESGTLKAVTGRRTLTISRRSHGLSISSRQRRWKVQCWMWSSWTLQEPALNTTLAWCYRTSLTEQNNKTLFLVA